MKRVHGSLRTPAGSVLVVCFAALSLGCSSPEQPAQTEISAEPQVETQDGPDYIFLNGKVLTVDDDFTVADAVAVTGNTISAVGSNTQINFLAASHTQIIDLDGKTMIPGIIDNHNHLIYTAAIWPNIVRLATVRTRAEALQAITTKAEAIGPGEGPDHTVLAFGGWKSLQFTDDPSQLTRDELDKAAPDNPVIVGGWGDAVVNSMAMRYTGMTKDTPDPDPSVGKIWRDENGELTGRFSGSVFIKWELRTLFAEVTGESVVRGLKHEIDDYLGYGVTTSMVYNSPEFPEPLFGYLKDHYADTPEQKMRIYYPPQFNNSETARSPEEVAYVVEGLSTRKPFTGSDMFQMTHFGEHVYRPIPGDGNVPEEDWAIYKEITTAAAANGWQVNEHAHRHSIMEREIEIYEEINELYPITDLRWRIEHSTTISRDLIERMKELGHQVESEIAKHQRQLHQETQTNKNDRYSPYIFVF